MKKKYLLPLMIVFCCVFSSCNKEKNEDNQAAGNIIFSYKSVSGIPKKASGQNLKQDSSSTEVPQAVIVSIIDSFGNVVKNMEEIPLYNMNGNFISKPLALKQGNYKLSDFLVVDKDGNVLYLTPKEGSPKAYLVSDPLPVEFNVSKDQVTKVNVEVLKNTGETPEEFGYSTFTFNVVDVFNFNVSVFTYSDSIQNFQLTSSVIEIFKDSSKIYENSLSPITNSIPLRKEVGAYTVVIKKNGYQDYSTNLTLSDLQGYSASNPLIVILSKAEFDLTNGLVAYYPFNGNANDESGNAHNGTVYGATLTADRLNKVNSAYHFNGIDQYIELPNDSSLKPEFPFSISFWVKLEEYSNTNQILTNDFQLENYTGVWFVVSINGNLIANYGNGGYISLSSRKSKMGNTTLLLNQWYHIVGVFASASQMEIYINGINDGGVFSGGATSLVYSDNSGAIGRKDIGDSTQPPYYFKGSVDEVAFYNRVLDTSEIISINGVK